MERNYIYETDNCYKLRVPTRDGKGIHRSVGFIRIGKRKALKKAKELRNTLGREEWHEHWDFILKNPNVLANLPHTIEPLLTEKPTGPNTSITVYRVMWGEYDEKLGRSKRVLRQYSLNEHGKLGAYTKAKRAIEEANKHVLSLLIFMGRAKAINLK